MSEKYSAPNGTSVGHVHLKVSDLETALGFYCELLGFDLKSRIGNDAAFLAAGDYHHHIGLNTWFSKNGSRPNANSTGLFHTAFLYPTRKDLAKILNRIWESGYKVDGASDHGVSEAIYLSDPDGNGVELYWDKPLDEWPKSSDGSLEMFTKALDVQDLLSELDS
ncbi:MAG: catechol 2,3-dioxygenase [Sphingobacteriales bacterium]|jgi:catechol 2,3-dioxygenase